MTRRDFAVLLVAPFAAPLLGLTKRTALPEATACVTAISKGGEVKAKRFLRAYARDLGNGYMKLGHQLSEDGEHWEDVPGGMTYRKSVELGENRP